MTPQHFLWLMADWRTVRAADRGEFNWESTVRAFRNEQQFDFLIRAPDFLVAIDKRPESWGYLFIVWRE